MSIRANRLALAFGLLGVAASGAATYVHYHLLRDPTYTSFCDVSATWSCTQVYMSRFGTFAGIPVALIGLLWFVVATLLAIAALGGPPSVREDVPGYLFVLSTLGLAVVLYLAYASFVVLQTKCPLCLVMYAAVIGLFLVSGAATSFPMTTLPRRAARDARLLFGSPLAITVAVLFLAGAATTLAFFPREATVAAAEPAAPPSQDQRSEFERYMATSPRVPLIIPAEGAKVLIVKFNDFQCPACGQSYLQYKPILAKYEVTQPGAVRLVLKDYPLASECNPNMTTTIHAAACEAAAAVRLARMHNRGDQMEEWLYTHQNGLTPAIVRQAARDVGQVNDFDAKYASTIDLVKGDIALGKQLGVHVTPTFFVNGIKFDGSIAPQYFDQAIQYELQRAK